MWHSNLPCRTSGGWRLMPTGLPLCLTLETGLGSRLVFQPAYREQGFVPINWPMKLHRSLLLSSRVLISPIQSVPLPGSLLINSFLSVCVIALPLGRDKDESNHMSEQTSSAINLKYPILYSPKRLVSVIVKQTKRTWRFQQALFPHVFYSYEFAVFDPSCHASTSSRGAPVY